MFGREKESASKMKGKHCYKLTQNTKPETASSDVWALSSSGPSGADAILRASKKKKPRISPQMNLKTFCSRQETGRVKLI